MRDGLLALTYTIGDVGMTRDAAHVSHLFHGQGARQASEDALVLETLL